MQYVVVHADRLAPEERGIIDAARANPRCRLVTQMDSDYLFEMLEVKNKVVARDAGWKIQVVFKDGETIAGTTSVR